MGSKVLYQPSSTEWVYGSMGTYEFNPSKTHSLGLYGNEAKGLEAFKFYRIIQRLRYSQ